MARLLKQGKEKYAKLVREFSEQAINDLESTTKKESLDCNFQRTSTLTLVRHQKQVSEYEGEVELKRRLGFQVEFLSKNQLARRLKADAWGAMEDLNDAVVNPYALVVQLIQKVRQLGGKIYEKSPLIKYKETSHGLEVFTAEGSITSRFLVLATDASKQNQGLAFPIQTHVIATEPLNNKVLQEISWNSNEALLDTFRIYHYGRLTPDNRILWGGEDAAVGKTSASDKSGMLKDSLFELFPQLKDIQISHEWSGIFGQTIDDIPFCHKPSSRVISIGGYGGSGIALGFAFGKEVPNVLKGAETKLLKLFGTENRNFLFRLSANKKVPFSLKKLGAKSYLNYLRLRDRLQF